jgi:peptide/nickel transport system substrate-binding protein
MSRLAIVAVLGISSAATAAGLRIGIQDDPDALDPATSGFFVGRVVFAALCDKLIDIDRNLDFVPQLATAWEWSPDARALTLRLRPDVEFHDGEKLDAAAIKVNIDRYRTASESRRKAEVKAIERVDVVDSLTVRLALSEPHAPLIAVLADRAGMMMSPKALAALGDRISTQPVCAGPFRFARRVAQERIVLERFERYWNAAAIHVDSITYMVVPDPTVRLNNLRAGALDMIERVAATDIKQVRGDQRLRLVSGPGLAFQALTINIANGTRAAHPLAQKPKLREALELAIDRDTLVQVVFDREFTASNQPEATGSRFYDASRPVPRRDLPRARALLREVGHERVAFSLKIINSPVESQVAQVIQAMAAEAGFDIAIEAMEASAQLAAVNRGDYEAAIMPWSGRVDPDGNVSIWLQCDGFINFGKYCNRALDDALAKARGITDVGRRQALYRDAARIYLEDRPLLFLYHSKWLWATRDKVDGFTPIADGLIRPQAIRVSE